MRNLRPFAVAFHVNPFDLDILQEHYTTELRWQLGMPKRENLTLQLWLDVIREDCGIAPVSGEQIGSRVPRPTDVFPSHCFHQRYLAVTMTSYKTSY
jgi:hypothetical protein